MAKRQVAEEATEETTAAANERDMEALKQAEKPAKSDEEDTGPALEFREAGQDEEDDGPGEEETRPERPSRKERRGNRFKEALERAERAEQAAAAQAARLAQLEQLVQRGVPQQQPQGPSVVEQYDAAIEANQTEQLQLSDHYHLRLQALAAAKQEMTREESMEWLRRSNALRDREQQLRIEKIAQANGYRPQQQQESPVVTMLRAEYHDVESNPAAKAYAQAFYRAAVARGEQEGLPLLRQALDYGREWIGGGGQAPRPNSKPAKPTPQQQSKYTGSAPGSSQARGTPEQSSNRVTLPEGLSMKEFKRLADKAFPHIKDDNKRYTHYYREIVAPAQSQGD